MIELDVDMGYLLEDGEPDCVTLNDENGEYEPMTFYRGNADAVEFCKRVESAVKERKPLTLVGVDYETVGDVPFCEQVDRWLHGDAPSECRECSDGKYAKLTALVDKTCTLKLLTPFATALMGILEPEWGVCSVCGSATPKVGSYCAICGAHVVKVVDE